MMNIIMATNNMGIIQELMKHLTDLYHSQARGHANDKQLILEEILSLIHTCLLALSKSVITKPEFKDIIFGIIDQHILSYGVEAEGINMISAVSSCYKKDFRYKMDEYWDKAMTGLDMVEQKILFRATLSCISDIARNHEQHIIEKLTGVFSKLVGMMKHNLDRDLKTDILKCFGDLALGLKKYTEVFLDNILEICGDCFEAVYRFSESEQDKAYAEELKESLIEMYHCLVFSVNEQNRCNSKMAAHFPFICTFIIQSNNLKYKPTVVPFMLCRITLRIVCS